MVGEAASRASLDLPGRQMDLVKEVARAGKPTIVVLVNGRPPAIGWIVENVPAILESWMGGTESGNAIADILVRRRESGRQAARHVSASDRASSDLLQPHEYRPSARCNNRYTSKYFDAPWTPQFPFGFGLSYTQFKISNVQLSATQIPAERD